jgi:two-component system C4-dicarboxylate transport sensor histidine kinase DctB
MLHRRHRAADEVAAQKAIRAELENRVSARTAQLREANEHLVTEMDDRRRAQASLQHLQEELVQANKLAFLGQITAGVAHEINQPVAAIRSFADNAGVFLERGNLANVQGNLASIADLTQRIGTITAELRTFSRKATGSLEATDVGTAVTGALLLVGNQMQRQGVTLHRSLTGAHLRVMAERVRLEQVLVNLLQNALDALDGQATGEIVVDAQAQGEHVRIRVQDNGPGIAPEVMAVLFTPFITTKAQGLGLGLVISRDIMAEFGGELLLESTPGGGTSFTLVLRKAEL